MKVIVPVTIGVWHVVPDSCFFAFGSPAIRLERYSLLILRLNITSHEQLGWDSFLNANSGIGFAGYQHTAAQHFSFFVPQTLRLLALHFLPLVIE